MSLPETNARRLMESVGRPLPGYRVRLADAESSADAVPAKS